MILIKQNSTNKETNIYENLEDFKENYLIDFSASTEQKNLINYLRGQKELYKKIAIQNNENRSKLYYSQLGKEQSKNLFEILSLDFELIENQIDKLISSNYEETQVFKQRRLSDDYEVLTKIHTIIKEKGLQNHEHLISEYINERYLSLVRMSDYFDEKIVPIDEIIEFISDEIAREKINLFRFQGNTPNQIEYKTEPDHENNFEDTRNDKKKIFDFFNNVRNEDLGDSDVIKLLKEYSDDFNIEVLNFILKDLDFYLFMERQEKESEYSPEDTDNAIKERIKNGLDIPYFKRPLIENLTDKQIEARKKLKESGFDLDAPILNKENLLFPYEFDSLYRLKKMINEKINNSKLILDYFKDIDNHNPKEKGQNIPYKIAMLDEIGVIKQLNIQYTNKTDIHKIIQFIVGGNIDNIKDYYNSIYGNYSGNNQITDKHREKTKEIYFK